jgi:hypothetical protein
LGRNGARGARRILDMDQVPKGASPGPAEPEGRMFFFEKKNQKNYIEPIGA